MAKNGTLGTVTAIDGAGERAQLTVRLDREDPTSGEAAVVVFGLAEYAHIDHGYAATIHKAQSVTVEWAHVLATPGMDRHLAYVALTRHRHEVALHWSEESFGLAERLAARLGRERAKDTTLDYGESEDEQCAVYAERRGLSPLAPASEIVVGPQVPEAGQAWRNLEWARLARELPLLVALQQATERQHAALAGLAAALERAQPRTAPEVFLGPLSRMLEQAVRETEFYAIPSEPMLPAVPYRPVTDDEVASLIDALEAQEPAADPLPGLLATIYRDPVSARQRLDALLVDGQEAAAERLRREGPALLGRLRGREGLLASQAAFTERQNATHAAGLLPDALLEPQRRRAALIQRYRGPLESDRRRDTIAVPGLSQAALAAMARLEQAGVDRRSHTSTAAMSAGQIAQAARVAAVWLAEQADERVCRELERFRDAVRRRLDGRFLSGSDAAALGARNLHGVLAAAATLAARHAALEAARDAERRQAERAAQDASEKAAQQAAMERLHQHAPRPRKGPRPGMG